MGRGRYGEFYEVFESIVARRAALQREIDGLMAAERVVLRIAQEEEMLVNVTVEITPQERAVLARKYRTDADRGFLQAFIRSIVKAAIVDYQSDEKERTDAEED